MTLSSHGPSVLTAVTKPAPSKNGAVAESGEMYLETIYVMQARFNGKILRAVDLANELGYSKPSVSRALSVLKAKDYINILDTGHIDLTEKGRSVAESVFERHRLLTIFLQYTSKVNSSIAEEDACRIEHVISEPVMRGIKQYLKDNDLL